MTKEINLGDIVKCEVTGFTGVAVARTIWLHGCARVTVQPSGLTKEGKIFEQNTFDELQLTLIKSKVVASTSKNKKSTGGPNNDKAALRRN